MHREERWLLERVLFALAGTVALMSALPRPAASAAGVKAMGAR